MLFTELRGIYIIWLRELIRWWRSRVRIISSLAIPFMWLVVLGTGLSSTLRPVGVGLAGSTAGHFNYQIFIFPGIIAQTIIFSSIFGALSIVYDREFGFFKEIFVAPISRASIVLGKTLGSATVSTFQASMVFLLTPLIGIKINFLMFFALLPFMFLLAYTLAAIGVAVAARMKSTENFQFVIQFLIFPMFFLGGTLFPLKGIPLWMDIFSKVNPVTYGVDMLRKIVFVFQNVPPATRENLTFDLFGRPGTIFADLFIVTSVALFFSLVAIELFKRA